MLKAHILDLERNFIREGRARCIFDESNRMEHFVVSFIQMLNLFARFLDFLLIDGTFRTNREIYFLYQLLIVDGFLKSLHVANGFLWRKTAVDIRQFLRAFMNFTTGRSVVRCVQADGALTIGNAIADVFASVHHLLCQVNIIRNGLICPQCV